MHSKNDVKNLRIFPSIGPMIRRELRVFLQQLNVPIGAAPGRGFSEGRITIVESKLLPEFCNTSSSHGLVWSRILVWSSQRFKHVSSRFVFSFECVMVSHAFVMFINV